MVDQRTARQINPSPPSDGLAAIRVVLGSDLCFSRPPIVDTVCEISVDLPLYGTIVWNMKAVSPKESVKLSDVRTFAWA